MKGKDHIRITEHTLKKYRTYLTPAFAVALATGDNEKELIQGTRNEDRYSIERATNWHFYRSENDCEFLQPFKGWFHFTYHPSSRNILARHNRKFTELVQAYRRGLLAESEDLFNLLGRLIHHVQDMNTPSHVVPVFHGFELFKDFKWEKDTYEKFSENNLEKYLEPGEGKLPFHVDVTDPEPVSRGFIDFYDRAARRTLDFLKSDASKFEVTLGSECVMASCDLFWQPYDRRKDSNRGKLNRGFGQYGHFEKYFGQDKILQINGVDHGILFTSYEHIYTKFIGSAVSDTLSCLMYADRCYTGSPSCPHGAGGV